jgi:iron complex transport system permease protein
VGAGLGVAGVIMQGLFRNPLAEPGVVGVSSGAALGAVAAFFFGWVALSRWILPGLAFLGAVAAVVIVYAISTVGRRQSIATLLLVGIAMNAFLAAIISAMVANARTEQELRSIIFWLQGGLEARTWDHASLIVIPIILGILITFAFARDLNVLLLGEDQARAAGVDVPRTRVLLLGIASVLTGVAVAVSGIIAFVGLVVPHMIRLAVGPDHRILLPASALAGALFLVLCDLGARMLFNPITLQVGVITALAGAPLFLWLILRSRGQGIA